MFASLTLWQDLFEQCVYVYHQNDTKTVVDLEKLDQSWVLFIFYFFHLNISNSTLKQHALLSFFLCYVLDFGKYFLFCYFVSRHNI